MNLSSTTRLIFVMLIIIFFLAFINFFTADMIKESLEKMDQLKPQYIEKAQVDVKSAETAMPSQIMLDVPLLNQMDAPRLYNGCEVTSLAMILNYAGVAVTKNELAEKINRIPLNYDNNTKGNPNIGFVGNMEDGPGYGVYHGPILELAKAYVGERAADLTGEPFDNILKKVGEGLPVWIITTTKFAPVSDFQRWETPQGPIDITFSLHSVAITGYDNDYIYFNDTYGYKNRKVDRDNFIKAWEQMGKQAVVVEKQ